MNPLLICLILSILLNLFLICAFNGAWMLKRSWQESCNQSRKNHRDQTRATLAAWHESINGWYQNHDSIPTSFLPLAIHMDEIIRENQPPPSAP